MNLFNLTWKFFVAMGVVFVGMGLYFLLIRPNFVMQPEDIRVAKLTGEQIKAISSDLFYWLTLVIRAWGSFCIAFGTMLIGIAAIPFRKKEQWAYYLLITSVLPLLVVFFGIQFVMKGDFYIPLAAGFVISSLLLFLTKKEFIH